MYAAILVYTASIALLALSHYAGNHAYKFVGKLVGYTLLLYSAIFLHQLNLIDVFSLVLGVASIPISLAISMFTTLYSVAHHYPNYLELLMDAFLVSIISAYIAPSFIFMIIPWTIGEILGYVLIKIGEERSLEGPLTSSRGFIFTSTLTYEISIFTLITLSLVSISAGMGLYELMKPFTQYYALISLPVVVIPLVVVGFLTKMANIPLHFWLPSAHSSAPSPASATLSGLMVSLGYYGLYRVFSLVNIEGYRAPLSWFFTAVGFMSILYGGFQALSQRDIKRFLAYSTIATNGFVSVVFGLYVLHPIDLLHWTLLMSIVMHAAYKTTLFCESGLIEAVYGTRYVHGIRGFAKVAPVSTMGGLFAVLSLLGVPGTLGFIAKLLAVYNAIIIMPVDFYASIASLIAFSSYIVISALVALKYARLYFDGTPSRVNALAKRLERSVQIPVFILGLFNALMSAIIIPLVSELYSSLIIITVAIAIATAYLAHSHLKMQIR